MALMINLKCVEYLPGKSDRQVRLTFRGKTQESNVVRSAKKVAYFGQSFEWPVARSVAPEEFVQLQVYNYNKYLTSKLVGTYTLGLQQLIHNGELKIDENLVDFNNRVLEVTISFEIRYYSPDGKVGNWTNNNSDFVFPLTEDYNPDVDYNKIVEDSENVIVDMSNVDLPGEDTASQNVLMETLYQSKRLRPDQVEWELHKPRDFQISITIIEGQQLAGLDIDPVIKVEVGGESRYTGIRQSNNCPYYNEYFVFDFREPPSRLLDKMITITAYHAYGMPGRSVLRAGNVVAVKRVIGLFKCDIATVYCAPEHQFYHKWAVLLDPKDIGAGPKGYVKCDIALCSRGESVKPPKGIKESDTNNIEGNLLLPAGVPMARQRVIYSVFIYRGEDLPRTDFGIMASLQKALTKKDVAFVDAFVQVSFVGHSGKTAVKKSYNPEWNEVVRFFDMVPPLCNRIMLQIKDKDPMSDDVIATHFIELSQIMDPAGNSEGILPTFGPSWIYFYGAPRSYQMIGDDSKDLNEGVGEGCAFRGRILVSIQTEIEESESSAITAVRVDKLSSGPSESSFRKPFILFVTLFEATMISTDLKEKPIYFEVSMGKYGNTLDGKPLKTIFDNLDEPDSDEESDAGSEEGGGGGGNTLQMRQKLEESQIFSHSITNPCQMILMDKTYGYLPLNEEKPCMYVVSLFEDYSKRIYSTNLLSRLTEKLSEGVEDVKQMFKMKRAEVDISRRIKGLSQTLQADCDSYLTSWSSLGIGVGSGKTKLDQHRRLACQKNVEKAKEIASKVRRSTTEHNIKEKLRLLKEVNRKLTHIIKDPQHSLPDILIWMICDKVRVAYYRIPAKDLLYSSEERMCGKFCGKRQTIFLKRPGKKGQGSGGWLVPAKLNLYMWLGEQDSNKSAGTRSYLEKLPQGYELIHEDVESRENPPLYLQYQDTYVFQLRAYIFEARSLIGSDNSGLSDPFARVIIGNHCRSTQIIEETLSPTWNETLIIDDILVYGLRNDLVSSTPIVIVEIYDYDKVGQPEFLGRVMATPRIKLEEEAYDPAQLEWLSVYRGQSKAGELLASFELLEGDTMELPPFPPIKGYKDKVPIMELPESIKPALSTYRLEVSFRGVRDLRRIQLMSVDHPRIIIDCAGQTLTSMPIEKLDKNSNFESQLDVMDIELPDNMEYWPPITIRCVDGRSFGRDVLVGTCTIDHIERYLWTQDEKTPEHAVYDENGFNENHRSSNPAILDVNTSETTNVLDTRFVSIDVSDTAKLQSMDQNSGGKTPELERRASSGSTNGSVNGGFTIVVRTPGGKTESLGRASTIDSTTRRNNLKKTAEEVRKERRDYKELIAELDWWNKYYVTKEDYIHEELENLEQHKDFDLDLIDYSDLNIEKIEELAAEAKTRAKEREALNEKKRKGKGKKKKKDKKKSKPKKDKDELDTKKKSTRLKGIVNQVFQKDDEESIASDPDAPIDESSEDKKHIARIKFYPHDLEKVKEFGGFKKCFETFPLYRGKKVDDEEEDFNRLAGLYKGNFCLYKLGPDDPDIEEIKDMLSPDAIAFRRATRRMSRKSVGPRKSIFQNIPVGMSSRRNVMPTETKPLPLKLDKGMPSNRTVELKVIVYVIKATDLHPVDFNGKADPYLIVRCGKHKIIDKENKINNELNPVFGRKFEFDVELPMASMLKIEVWDYDTLSADDLIGETCIDLEDRFYSQHRPSCGLQQKFELYGYNAWRDPQKPTQILEKLCRESDMREPVYRPGTVEVNGRAYFADEFVDNEHGERLQTREHLALEVLKHWQDMPGGHLLVPEHIETRPLYCNERPGAEQGKLEMWVDMFPKDAPMPLVQVEITPRKPKSYELRCIIWNTDEVTLDDTNALTGEQSSDIFVKGYLKGVGVDDQQTDVHYRSMTGEGNFNWRFVYQFDYLKAEDRVVFRKKESIFEMGDVEYKVPPNFTIQVWDADLVSSDDFLGSIVLDLNNMPKPAKNVKKCSLKMLSKSSRWPSINLFKNKRCKGWYAVAARETDEEGTETSLRLKGKVEVELHLLTAEEAEKNPVGVARLEPEALSEPKRPDTSFIWFLNPLKTLYYIIWKNYKWLIIKIIVILIFLIFLVLFVYNFPQAIVNLITTAGVRK